jgi:hypothetical protein
MEIEMLSYRYNAPSVYTPRVAVIDTTPPVDKRNLYDWEAAKSIAERGIIPAAPRFPATNSAPPSYQYALDTVVQNARAGNVKELKEMQFKLYNNRWRLIVRYRDLCVKALLRSPFKR